jgi:hypothetical protein
VKGVKSWVNLVIFDLFWVIFDGRFMVFDLFLVIFDLFLVIFDGLRCRFLIILGKP